jgi:hypothetical protein
VSKRTNILKRAVGDAGGYQIVKARRQERKNPDWVNSDAKIKGFIIRAFPNLDTDSYQAEVAGRLVRVLYLYFRIGYTNTQIAEETGLKLVKVDSIIRRIRNFGLKIRRRRKTAVKKEAS